MNDTVKRYVTILGAITATVAVLSIGGNITVWALDTTYVRQDALASEFNRQRLQQLSDQIDDLELKSRLKMATPLDKAKLEQLKRKREELLK